MALSEKQIAKVENLLKTSLRNKFKKYNPEPAAMPFHTRLLGKDRMALFSFIHSLNTNFGANIFEPVAVEIASTKYKIALSQQSAGEHISSRAHHIIQTIMDKLATAEAEPDKLKEIESIREVCQIGEIVNVRLTRVDIQLISHDGTIYLFDLKTAKPNVGIFKELKRTLLEWVAAILCENPDADIRTFIAIPYNPYEPKPYNRWTMRGMLDLEKELMIGEEFWNFLGGEGTYTQLLDIFEHVGIELRSEIDDYFAKYN